MGPIGDWTEAQLLRWLSQKLAAEVIPKPKSAILEVATITDVLRVTNRLELSPQAIVYLQSKGL